MTGNVSIDSANFTTPYDLRSNDTLNLGDIVAGMATSEAAAAASPPITNNVTIRANGTFTYNPPPGFEGSDSFNYTLTNVIGSDIGTVTLTVSEVVWFVNNALGSNGDGRLSAPFNSLANFVSGAADDIDDYIFLYTGSGNYTGGITLLAGQRLIGQGVALASFITPANGSAALPGSGSYANGRQHGRQRHHAGQRQRRARPERDSRQQRRHRRHAGQRSHHHRQRHHHHQRHRRRTALQ